MAVVDSPTVDRMTLHRVGKAISVVLALIVVAACFVRPVLMVGIGLLVVVIVGATPPATTVRLKAVGPAEPAELVAVIIIEVTATALGVPVSRPPDDRLAHAGNPVPLQVIGAPPVAVN